MTHPRLRSCVGTRYRRCGIAKPARIYDLRSTFISNARASGLTVFETARIAGTSVDMIELHYGALLDTAHDALLERLETNVRRDMRHARPMCQQMGVQVMVPSGPFTGMSTQQSMTPGPAGTHLKPRSIFGIPGSHVGSKLPIGRNAMPEPPQPHLRMSTSRKGLVCPTPTQEPQCLHLIASGLIASLQYGHVPPCDGASGRISDRQCLHRVASALISSAQNGHDRVSDWSFIA